MKYLQQKYRLMMESVSRDVSERGSVSSESVNLSKIQEWVDRTEHLGEQNDSGLADEMNAHASDNPKLPKERQTPKHTQHTKPAIQSDQPGQPGQHTSTQNPKSTDIQQSNVPSDQVSPVGGDFSPKQRSTPLRHQKPVPPQALPPPTAPQPSFPPTSVFPPQTVSQPTFPPTSVIPPTGAIDFSTANFSTTK